MIARNPSVVAQKEKKKGNIVRRKTGKEKVGKKITLESKWQFWLLQWVDLGKT